MSARTPPARVKTKCDACSNIAIMQLFHELKQQFPTVPDHLVNECIAEHCHDRPACRARLETEAHRVPRAAPYPPCLMGHHPRATDSNHNDLEPAEPLLPKERDCVTVGRSSRFYVDRHACESTRSDLERFRLEDSVAKPPHSPIGAKKLLQPTRAAPKVPEEPPPPRPTSLNLSLNVNCSMDITPSPKHQHSSSLDLVPQHPWMLAEPLKSPRSYTSVNLTLRPPSAEPQAPIDIRSANSSLTYSTSTFDSKQGLQSRLQITVGPGGLETVSSSRTRPSSSYFPEPPPTPKTPHRAESLPDLARSTNDQKLALFKQQSRHEALLAEVETERLLLASMQEEVRELEKPLSTSWYDMECQRLEEEIIRLSKDCESLAREVDLCNADSTVPLGALSPEHYPLYEDLRRRHPENQRPSSPTAPPFDAEGPPWVCRMCTFQNHPLLQKCEQCEMLRILGTNALSSGAPPHMAGVPKHVPPPFPLQLPNGFHTVTPVPKK